MSREKVPIDEQIRLYSLLVDQLQRYNSLIWQIPTGLLVANVLAIDKFQFNSCFLFCLSVFNYVLIYIFHRMLVQQEAIKKATQLAEKKLKKLFPDYIAEFPQKHISSTVYFRFILVILNTILLAFSIYIFFYQHYFSHCSSFH